jgi:hypothetical protein
LCILIASTTLFGGYWQDYDEDTMSLVEDPTLTTVETLLSNNSNFSAGSTPIDFEYYCYEIEADAPRLNYHGPKIMIPKTRIAPYHLYHWYNWYYM